MRATRLLYRLLLLTWPARIRREHGRELETLFVSCLETAGRGRGFAGYARVWLAGMADVVVSAPGAHCEEWRTRRRDPHPASSALVSGMSDLLRDARFAMRSWMRQRSLTLTVLATLVVCLGGNTVIFSVVRTVLLK